MFVRPYAVLSAAPVLCVPHLSTASTRSTTSCRSSKQHPAEPNTRHQRRRYATATSAAERPRSSKKSDGEHVWPDAPEGHTCPTPYQIFAMSRTQTYSKNQFYNLVKLYHPDRGEINAHHLTLPLHVRLERYRLIVAAHNILSDPSKRSAYDRLGVGWQGRNAGAAGASAGGTGQFSGNWQDISDPIWSNATWEDWERYQAKKQARESGHEEVQRPLLVSNATFMLLVFATIFAGSAVNLNRAKDNGQYFVEQRDVMHDQAAKDLRRVRIEKQTMGDRTDRVEWFIRQREATLDVASSDIALMRDEMADRVLPNREICRSEEVVQKDPSEHD